MMLFQNQSGKTVGDGLGTCVYQQRRDPVLVCPHCKRAVDTLVSMKDGKPFDIFRCSRHGDVVAIWSEVVNEY
jgi:uncharacterized radical SAM superfamily Fe-S cluster-containing enzyme